jgi:alginate O-acetyltransferase complex protein AlgI
LAVGIVLNLALLFYYKYLGFIVVNVNRIPNVSFSIPNIILPVGISFFTFQGMSYIIDAYRGKAVITRNIIDFALYISLFPQLNAGPIVNYKDIYDQLRDRPISSDLFSAGINRFIIGLSKKIFIADVLGSQAANLIEALPLGIDRPSAWLAMICYAFQIYFDFSAYSDMALGLAKMFGFSLLENFNYPYTATSITDFWRRWHISLSTWFKDYLYIPLGGSRKGNVYLHLFIVFCATGLWHGARWQFLLWGLWHGAFLILEKMLIKKNLLYKIPSALRRISTVLIIVMGWVLFSADGLSGALEMYKILLGIASPSFVEFSFGYYFNRKIIFTLIIAAVGSTPAVARLIDRYKDYAVFNVARCCVSLALLFFCIVNAVSGTYSPFIYFRF